MGTIGRGGWEAGSRWRLSNGEDGKMGRWEYGSSVEMRYDMDARIHFGFIVSA